MAELALSLKEDMAALARERMVAGKADPTPKLAEGKGETRDAIADMAGVSHGTLDKVERIEAEAIPDVFLTGISDRVSVSPSGIKLCLFNCLETARR